MRFSLNFIKEFLKVDLPAQKIASLLTMSGMEVEHFEKINEDWVFDIEVTSNRYDWLSIIGIARELAVTSGKKLVLPYSAIIKKPPYKDRLIKIENSGDCPFYVARVIRNVKLSASNRRLKERINHCQINSINNVVDITNYCMLKWGNPLHAFDEDKIEGNIHIRRAKEKESFIGIDGKERILNKENLVIADDKKVIALAGVMGAKNTEVTENTKNVLLEAAIFSPLSIRHSRRAVGLDTDSSYRFERQVCPDYLEYASAEAASLMKEIAAGQICGYAYAGKKPLISGKKITLKLSSLNEYLGAQFNPAKVKNILSSLDFEILRSKKDALTLVSPKFRFDIKAEVDIYEEISRIYGYDKIKPQLPRFGQEFIKNNLYEFKKEIRNFLQASGLKEIISYSIDSEKDLLLLGEKNYIKLINPLRKQEDTLRTTLLTGMIKAVGYNLNRSRADIKFFEIANIYSKKDSGFCEMPSLSIGLSAYDNILYLKGIVEEFLNYLGFVHFEMKEEARPNFKNCLKIFLGAKYIGFLGKLNESTGDKFELKKSLFYCELDINSLLLEKKLKMFEPFSSYPAIFRDISLALRKDKSFKDVYAIIGRYKESISDYSLVNFYEGKDLAEGFCAFCLRLFYQSASKTLVAEEVDTIHNRIRAELAASDGVTLR